MNMTNGFSENKVISDPISLAIPLYVQIAESLLERIRVGELVPEERLPSERELSKSLNVSRMTLRAALRELDNKGLLVRRPGDGTYVAKPKIERQAAKLVPFTENMRSRGYRRARGSSFSSEGWQKYQLPAI